MPAIALRRERWVLVSFGLLVLGVLTALMASQVFASPSCKPVKGKVVDQASSGANTSEGTFIGTLSGDYLVTVNPASVHSAGGPAGVVFITGTSQLSTGSGDLFFFESSSLDTTEQTYLNGAALLTITSGIGDYSGASGHLALSGYFHASDGTGAWDYQGVVCK